MESVSQNEFRVVRKTRVSEEVIGQVRDLIPSGRLKIGDRLPAERELAKTLQVGRSTVREAIRALKSLGILQARSGGGTFLVSHYGPYVKTSGWQPEIRPGPMLGQDNAHVFKDLLGMPDDRYHQLIDDQVIY